MISLYGIAVMGILFFADIIYTYAFNNNAFLKMGKKSGVLYAVLRLFILVLLPYWIGTYLMGAKSAVIQILICFALSAALMSLEYFLQKQSDEASSFLYIPAFFTVSLVILLFINGYDFEQTIKNRFIYSLSGLALSLFSVLAYSSIKSKISAFRYGKALTVVAAAVSSLVFGMVIGVIIYTCLG